MSHHASDRGGDRDLWESRYAERGEELHRVPSSWVVATCLELPSDWVIVDVAGGTGRHAAALADAGRTVVIMDFILRAVRAATLRSPRILGVVADVAALPLRRGAVDAIVCVSFLDRAAFPVLIDLLRPGGALVYETYMRRHVEIVDAGRARGPKNPAFLLEPGELRRLVTPLSVEDYAERVVHDPAGERWVAQVSAVKK